MARLAQLDSGPIREDFRFFTEAVDRDAAAPLGAAEVPLEVLEQFAVMAWRPVCAPPRDSWAPCCRGMCEMERP